MIIGTDEMLVRTRMTPARPVCWDLVTTCAVISNNRINEIFGKNIRQSDLVDYKTNSSSARVRRQDNTYIAATSPCISQQWQCHKLQMDMEELRWLIWEVGRWLRDLPRHARWWGVGSEALVITWHRQITRPTASQMRLSRFDWSHHISLTISPTFWFVTGRDPSRNC